MRRGCLCPQFLHCNCIVGNVVENQSTGLTLHSFDTYGQFEANDLNRYSRTSDITFLIPCITHNATWPLRYITKGNLLLELPFKFNVS